MHRLSNPRFSDKAIEAVVEVLQSGQLVHGVHCNAFEAELAEYIGCQHTVLVSSGTAALHIALMSLDVGRGDAVLVPDFTYPATANVVYQVGGRVVLVDVDPSTYTISIEHLEQIVLGWKGPERLRMVVPVHEFGQPVNMDRLLDVADKHSLLIVEDAACALGTTYSGRKVGTFGSFGCFSFHPRKNLTTGEGGLICTNDPFLGERARYLSRHGSQRLGSSLKFIEPGLNYRLTDFQAALGRFQLPDLDEMITHRHMLSQIYCDLLEPLSCLGLIRLPTVLDGHNMQTYMIVLAEHINRDMVASKLAVFEIESGQGAQSLSYIGLFGENESHAIGSQLHRRGLALPLHGGMSDSDVAYICEVLSSVLRTYV